ncbi:MAG: hypothetical protein ACM3Q4_04720 [Acidobacteriota bacterium]
MTKRLTPEEKEYNHSKYKRGQRIKAIALKVGKIEDSLKNFQKLFKAKRKFRYSENLVSGMTKVLNSLSMDMEYLARFNENCTDELIMLYKAERKHKSFDLEERNLEILLNYICHLHNRQLKMYRKIKGILHRLQNKHIVDNYDLKESKTIQTELARLMVKPKSLFRN